MPVRAAIIEIVVFTISSETNVKICLCPAKINLCYLRKDKERFNMEEMREKADDRRTNYKDISRMPGHQSSLMRMR